MSTSYAYTYLKEGPRVASLGTEELTKKIKEETSILKDLLDSVDSLVPSHDPEEDYGIKAREAGGETMHTLRLQRKALEMHGRTLEIMTIDDWRSHELAIGLSLVIYEKFVFLLQLEGYQRDFRKRNALVDDDDKDTCSSRNKQFKELLYHLVGKSNSLHLLDIWCPDLDGEELYPLICSVMYSRGLVFLLEVIVESSSICASLEDMREYVMKTIADFDGLPLPALRDTSPAERQKTIIDAE